MPLVYSSLAVINNWYSKTDNEYVPESHLSHAATRNKIEIYYASDEMDREVVGI